MNTDVKNRKRSKQLAILSNEHHNGLLFVAKLRYGLEECIPLEKLQEDCKYYWKKHISLHFLQEEQVLLQYISPQHDLAIQLKSEHNDIRELIISIDHKPDTMTIGILADLISRHIHFEENTFFRYLEETLSNDQLDEICKQLNKLQSTN